MGKRSEYIEIGKGLTLKEDYTLEAYLDSKVLTTDSYGRITDYNQFVNVKAYGAVGDDIADDTTAIQNAINATPQYGTVVIPPGTYKISSGINLSNPLTLLCYGRLHYVGTGPYALKITGNDKRIEKLYLYRDYSSTGNATVALQYYGLYLYNSKINRFIDTIIEGFNNGVRLEGEGDGTAYNFFYNLETRSCCIGWKTVVKTGGWVNENRVIGGKFHIGDGYTNYVGTRFVDIDVGSTGNKFYDITMESSKVEYKLLIAGNDNSFINIWWEGSNNTADIYFEDYGDRNIIFGTMSPSNQKIVGSQKSNRVLDATTMRKEVRDITLWNISATTTFDDKSILIPKNWYVQRVEAYTNSQAYVDDNNRWYFTVYTVDSSGTPTTRGTIAPSSTASTLTHVSNVVSNFQPTTSCRLYVTATKLGTVGNLNAIIRVILFPLDEGYPNSSLGWES